MGFPELERVDPFSDWVPLLWRGHVPLRWITLEEAKALYPDLADDMDRARREASDEDPT